MYNTPPTYPIYIAGLVFKWLEGAGRLGGNGTSQPGEAELLYRTIDASAFYHNPVQADARSLMNVPFTLADESRNVAFLDGAVARGLTQLKGHKSVGGMRRVDL